MRKIVFNLVSKKVDNDEKSYPQLSCLYNSLLIWIVDTPENHLSRVEVQVITSKVRTYSAKSLSKLFSCSLRKMYNIFHLYQRQRLMLRSYITGIDSMIGPNRYHSFFILKKSQWIKLMDRETPSCNYISKYIRLHIFHT